MRIRTRPLPFLDPLRPATSVRWALAVIGLTTRIMIAGVAGFLLAGCMVGPFPAEPSAQESDTLVEPAAPRSKAATEPRKIPSCTRVWSEVLADSTWSCPDPRPPSPDFGRSG